MTVNEKDKQEEFMRLYRCMHRNFVGYCRARSYGILEYRDLVSESLLRAFEGFDRLKDKGAFAGYLYGTASNILKNELRKRKNRSGALSWDICPEVLEENHAVGRFDAEILYRALQQLPDAQKEALILFEINGYSLKEVAEIQNAGISSVKQRLKRGRERLAELLGTPAMKNEPVGKRSGILVTMFLVTTAALCYKN